jgi:aspartate ammonia-lyase
MNINEIIANCALINLGKKPGGYDFIDPIEHANIFQSTNDTVPTALKLAIMQMLGNLSEKINNLRAVVEQLESVHRNSLRIGYTQMQAAVPSSFGMLFGAYNEALSRDWWRVSKCFERIKTVNLGGSATGTAMGVPRFFVMEAVPTLQALTSLPITRSENLPDATSNLDAFVEIHATIKAHAVNLEKIVSDIRLLASDIASSGEMSIPARQVGSSIMPGKVNPVIPEYVISCAHTVYSNDMLISGLCAQGCLELNAYLPSIGNAILNSLELLTACNDTIRLHLFTGLTVNENTALERLIKSPVITTALTPVIGYHKAGQLAARMKEKGETIFEANNHLKIISDEKLRDMLKPQELLKTGFSLSDLEKSE